MQKRYTLIPLKEKVAAISKKYDRLEGFLKKELFGVLYYSPAQEKRIKSNIRERIRLLDRYNAAWAKVNIYGAYDKSAEITDASLDRLEVKKKTNNRTRRKAARSKKKAAARFLTYTRAANKKILERVDMFFRLMARSKKTLQIQNFIRPEESWWTEEIVQEIDKIKEWSFTLEPRETRLGFKRLAKPSEKEVAKRVKGVFENVFGKDMLFIEIPLKGGGVRNYSPRSYFTMVARTEMRNTQTQATVDRCVDRKNDLVQVSNHAKPCRICIPFEGQIFSISGKSETYPPLDSAPPFHSNCEHNLDPITSLLIELEKPRRPDLFPKPNWNLEPAGQLKTLKVA